MSPTGVRLAWFLALALALTAASCSADSSPVARATRPGSPPTTQSAGTVAVGVYAHTGPGDVAETLAGVPARVYVPNSEDDSVDVIDPATYAVVDHFGVGRQPQHISPSWDLQTLWVDNDQGNTLTPIDPRLGRPGPDVPVTDPYNLYFTPDGSRAVVVAERLGRIDFRDPHSWALIRSLPVPCRGVDHGDFTADGATMLLSCEFSGQLVRVDLGRAQGDSPGSPVAPLPKVTGTLDVGGSPVDVRLAPDGSVFYVANQERNGVSVVDAGTMTEVTFIPTGKGAHGLYPSRDATVFYVSNRLDGSVSVVSPQSRSVVATWKIGGSPDMGGVTTDGTQLWLTGRYHAAVYVIDTRTGALLHTIRVHRGPHGLCLFPQPGRYSLGHTGNFR